MEEDRRRGEGVLRKSEKEAGSVLEMCVGKWRRLVKDVWWECVGSVSGKEACGGSV